MLEIFINNKRVTQFNNFSITRSLDNVGDTFIFTTPFFPDIRDYRELFRPFAYQSVVVKISGKTILTGNIEAVTPSVSPEQNTVTVQGRSKPGVIVDCTFEKADFPVQFTKLTIDKIAAQVIEKFGFGVRFFDDPGPIFEEVGPQSPGETVFSFIQNLARQRQLLMSSTEGGALLFWRANTEGKPVASLIEGNQGLTVSNAIYNGTARYSRYEVYGQEYGKNDNFSFLEDPELSDVIRPKSGQANNTNASNINDSASWAATTSIAQSIIIPIELEGWTTPDGQLWDANTIITLQAPSLMIYKPFSFLIVSVMLNESIDSRTTSLTLTIPGAYSGKLPVTYPWQD